MTRGQGNPIPSFLKREGEWIIENVAFLYRADYSVASPEASLTVVAERQDGSYAWGFDSSQLAGAFGIEVTALLAANQNNTLVYVGTKDVAPGHGGYSAVAHIFRIGDRYATLTVETHRHQQEGTA